MSGGSMSRADGSRQVKRAKVMPAAIPSTQALAMAQSLDGSLQRMMDYNEAKAREVTELKVELTRREHRIDQLERFEGEAGTLAQQLDDAQQALAHSELQKKAVTGELSAAKSKSEELERHQDKIATKLNRCFRWVVIQPPATISDSAQQSPILSRIAAALDIDRSVKDSVKLMLLPMHKDFAQQSLDPAAAAPASSTAVVGECIFDAAMRELDRLRQQQQQQQQQRVQTAVYAPEHVHQPDTPSETFASGGTSRIEHVSLRCPPTFALGHLID